jgi:DNA replication protein DnaC
MTICIAPEETRLQRLDRMMPPVYRGHPILPEIAEWTDRFTAGSTANLIITGPVGVGKTTQAWQAARRALLNGYQPSIAFIHAVELSAAFRGQSGVDAHVIEASETAGLLVIDSVDAAPSVWRSGELDWLVKWRQRTRRPMLVTSIRPLHEVVGGELETVLFTHATVVALSGPDRRKPAGGVQ